MPAVLSILFPCCTFFLLFNLFNLCYSQVSKSKSKVMRCLRYGNGGQMHMMLNGQPLQKVDCFEYLLLQMAAAGECDRDVVHNERGV